MQAVVALAFADAGPAHAVLASVGADATVVLTDLRSLSARAATSAAYAYARLPKGAANTPSCAAWVADGTGGCTLFVGCESGHLLSLPVPALPPQPSAAAAVDITDAVRLRARLHTGIASLSGTFAVSSDVRGCRVRVGACAFTQH